MKTTKAERAELEQKAAEVRKSCSSSASRLVRALERLKVKIEMDRQAKSNSLVMPPRRA